MTELVLTWLVVILVIALFISVTRKKRQRKTEKGALKRMEYHDPICDLPLRSLIETAIQTELYLVKSGYGVVIFIDMDGFKPINDEHGKETGDEVLRLVAERLKKFVKDEAFLCRYCSDEFIIYLPANFIHDAMLMSYLERMKHQLSLPFSLSERQHSLTASIGFYRINAETKKPTMAIQAADIAMGESKRQGGGVITEFTDELNERYQRELSIKSELQEAITQEQLRIVYQPIVDCKTHRIVSAEALVRWERPEGQVPPSEFVPIAEQSRQIIELNHYILCQAIREFSKLPGEARLSINIPASQLHATDLVNDVERILTETQLPSARLYLELTETELVVTSPHVSKQLNGLRKLGVSIALDDFGTGYSNLQYLKTLPVDIIKLDRTFIESIDKPNVEYPFTDSILTMLNAMDKYLIVEGIENRTQAEYLSLANVNALQGFYFYKPMDIRALKSLVAT